MVDKRETKHDQFKGEFTDDLDRHLNWLVYSVTDVRKAQIEEIFGEDIAIAYTKIQEIYAKAEANAYQSCLRDVERIVRDNYIYVLDEKGNQTNIVRQGIQSSTVANILSKLKQLKEKE